MQEVQLSFFLKDFIGISPDLWPCPPKDKKKKTINMLLSNTSVVVLRENLCTSQSGGGGEGSGVIESRLRCQNLPC